MTQRWPRFTRRTNQTLLLKRAQLGGSLYRVPINESWLYQRCRNLAQYRPCTKPIVTFSMASSSKSRRARLRPMDCILLGQVSFLSRQTILDVRKPEFGTALAPCCVEYLIFFDETCSQKKGHILTQQWPITQVCKVLLLTNLIWPYLCEKKSLVTV